MRTLAVIAHDHQKADLVAWATFNRELMQDKVGLTFFVDLVMASLGDERVRPAAAWASPD